MATLKRRQGFSCNNNLCLTARNVGVQVPEDDTSRRVRRSATGTYLPCAYLFPYLVYRVAQNKIPHQTICSIFTTSGQILKILEPV